MVSESAHSVNKKEPCCLPNEEGNFGYINHFERIGMDPESRGLLYEVSADYGFRAGRFEPFLTAGMGGITSKISEFFADDEFFNKGPALVHQRGHRLEDGDTFFMFTYGGGLKAHRLWGPVGLRGDIRGRTLPNVFGDSTTWLEYTGGDHFQLGRA